MAADAYVWSGLEESPIGLGSSIEDVVAADYDGDGTSDLIVFDGKAKRVWLRNTPIPDGFEPEVWFESEEPECRDDEPTWDRPVGRYSTSGWVAVGSHAWKTRHGFPAGCDPEADDCPITTVTRQEFAGSMRTSMPVFRLSWTKVSNCWSSAREKKVPLPPMGITASNCRV